MKAQSLLCLLCFSTVIASEKQLEQPKVKQEVSKIVKQLDSRIFKVQTELKAKLRKIQETVDMSFSAIDEESVRNSWREGLSMQRDVDFDTSVVFYKTKKLNDFPCKNINFLFNIKSDLDVYEYNAEKYFLCWLKYNADTLKELLSDVVTEGVVGILKSGYSNPVSTFFSNVLIVEGPKKLKEELFAAFYRYVDENQELTAAYDKLKDLLIKLCFDAKTYEHEREHFIVTYSVTLLFFLYDTIIVYMKDRDVYLSAYDFIQPESNLITNPDSMSPKYLSENYMKILEMDLEKFKEIDKNYKETSASTIYHKSYAAYIKKNIKLLCRYLYKKDEC